MRAVVITFDSLGPESLGCYGNLEGVTPALDRWAAHSTVFDQHFGENFAAERQDHAWWTGRGTLGRTALPGGAGLWNRLQAAGVRTRLIVEHGVALPWKRQPFDAVQTIECAFDTAASAAASGTIATLEAAAAQLSGIEKHSVPELLWVHARGLPASAEMLECTAALDSGLGNLFRALEAGSREPLLCMLTSDRGGALPGPGESAPQSLREEVIHSPLIVRLCGVESLGQRTLALAQTTDLAPSLCDWFGLSSAGFAGRSWLPLIHGKQRELRTRLFLGCGQQVLGIRTPDFFYRVPAEQLKSDDDLGQLFQKPDDRWDTDDRARQFPADTADLHTLLQTFSKSLGIC